MREELKKILAAYIQKEETLPQFGLRDLLTDVMHLALEAGFDFDAALAGANEVFEEERFLEEN